MVRTEPENLLPFAAKNCGFCAENADIFRQKPINSQALCGPFLPPFRRAVHLDDSLAFEQAPDDSADDSSGAGLRYALAMGKVMRHGFRQIHDRHALQPHTPRPGQIRKEQALAAEEDVA